MTEQAAVADAVAAGPVVAPKAEHIMSRLWRHRSGRLALLMLGLLALVVVVGPFLLRNNASSDIRYQNLAQALLLPSGQHLLGTDQLGRDELVRLVLGAKYTFLIGIGAVVTGVVIGVPLGALSGFFRGWIDLVVQRIVDIVLAFPSFLLALALVAALGPGLRNLIIAVAVAAFPRFVRIVRGQVLSVRERPFVEAAHAVGIGRFRILWRYVLPNSMTPVLVQAPLELGSAVLTGAGLGFLGLGVRSPTPEWGTMLGESRDLMFSHPRLVTFPGICIVATILAFNLLGDALRDLLDPRLRSRVRIPRRRRA
jgi:ABC-type dipeptide/oligopeptide/nickel transport system permease subunit